MAELNDIQLRIIVQGTGLDTMQRLSDHLGKVAGGMAGATGAAKGATSAWTDFRNSLSELEHKFDAVFRAASHLQALGADLTGMGQAGIGMLKGAVDAWGEYEFAIHRASGALGIFDTHSPMFAHLQEAVNDAAQEVRLFPAEEIARAVYYWGSATGQTVENQQDLTNVMNGLIPILKTAAITEADYEAAIKGTYQIVQQYNLGLTRLATEQDVASGKAKRVGEELSNVGDITEKLMMITQNTSLEYQDLIESFRYTGSIAPALGVSWEELAVVLGRLGDLGIRGSGAGRALQQTFSKLVDPTVRASKALDEAWQKAYGLDKTFNDMVFPEGKFIGLTEYIDQLADVTEDMTQKERNNLIAIMTTQNELRTMVPLIEDQIRARREGISVYDSEKFALENASEQFARTMHLLEISWKGTMGFLTATIGPIVRLIGAQVASIAAPFIEQFGVILKSVKAWLDTHPEIVEWGVKLAAVASIVLVVAGALFTALGVLLAFGAGFAFVIGGVKRFLTTFPRFVPILGAVIAIVTALATNFGGLRDAVINVVDSLINVFSKLEFDGGSLSQIGKEILPVLEVAARAVAGVLNGVAWALDRIAESPEAIKVVQGIATALLTLFAIKSAAKIIDMSWSMLTFGRSVGQVTPLLGRLSGALVRFPWDLMTKGSAQATGRLTETFKVAGSMVGGFVAKWSGFNAISSLITKVAPKIKGGLSLMLGPIGLIITAVGLLATAWVTNFGGIQEKTKAVVGWITARFNQFAEWFGGIIDTVGQFIQDAIDWFGHLEMAIKMRIHVAAESVRTAIGNIITFFSELPGRIGDFLNELWTNVTTAIGNIITTIIEFPGKAWDGLVGAIAGFFENYNKWWDDMGVSTNERLGFILGYVWTWMGQVIQGFIDWAISVYQTIEQWATDTTAAFQAWVISVWDTITTWFKELPGHIWNFLVEIWTNFTTWFGETLQAFIDWATSVFETVSDWFSKLPGRIWEWLTSVWNNLSAWWSKTITDIGIWAESTINKVIEWFQKLPGRIGEWLTNTWNKLRDWFTLELIPGVGIWANNTITEIIKFFKEFPDRALRAIDNITNKLRAFLRDLPGVIWDAIVGVGTNIVNGIRKGIQDAWNGFVNWWTGLFSGMEKGAAAATQSRSPSRVYMRLGKDIMDGLRLGIERNNGATQAMDDQIHSILDTAQQLKSVETGLSANMSFVTDDERHLIIDHRVSSPDGTVNNASRETLREIFTAEEFVSSLEHMATVG